MKSKYILPPEWEEQERVWLSWPHNKDTWEPDLLLDVEREYAYFVAELSEVVQVKVLVLNLEHKKHVGAKLPSGVLPKIEFVICATNDSWIRDYGPDFVLDITKKEKVILDWQFNSWGEKYPPFDFDNNVSQRIVRDFSFKSESIDMILEGGSFDVNGEGDLLTTRSCLLNENRNPALGKFEIEEYLKAFLGVRKVHWLTEGIAGDDTDGHIDDVARFVDALTIVYVGVPGKNHPDYEVLNQVEKELNEIVLVNGVKPELVPLPVPETKKYKGEVLPCSYANFLICNTKVLVPTFDCLEDMEAISTLQKVFIDKKVVGVPAQNIIVGLGSLHCLSKHEFKLKN